MIERLGPYRIEGLLGRGGMGTVYLGVHEELGKRAAVKALSPHLVDEPEFRSRFIAEIETLRKLNHPNIVQLYGEGIQDGELFYVMEYVDGQSLQDELRYGHRFGWQEVSRIALDTCAALTHAHDRGVIHRDLKPANLLRDTDGCIKLTDFGIAKLFGATHLTAAGSVMGTADFISPEQAEGKQVTTRSDLYSLGSVMYTLLARQPPFTATSTSEIIHRLRHDAIPSVRLLVPEVPAALDQIIRQLLQKVPERRIPTARALANRLRALEDDLQSSPAGGSAAFRSGGQQDALDPASKPTKQLPQAGDEVSPAPIAAPQASIPTDVSQQPTGLCGDEAASDETDGPPDTITEFSPANQFRPVGADSPANDGADDAGQNLTVYFNTAWLALALVAIVLVAAWAAWPPSANQLYAQILSAAEKQEPSAAKKQIDEFLRRFPQDPRREEVDNLRRDVESANLQSRLALRDLISGGVDLDPCERLYLDAMRLKRKDPAAAGEKFRQILQQPEQAENNLHSVLQAARHQLRRLDEHDASPGKDSE